ncbi:MAG: AraC family transcriptional regulator [Betaproteobacteria bacterium]|jgi:AraC-like DNA-binding protein|nr:AraC family transcriptional regulator [Betaproteobacteria bacterium]
MADRDQPGAWLLRAFAMGGVDVQELFRRLPKQMDLATRAPETLTPDVVNAILLECASLSADDNFGLRMVELAGPSDLGIYGYLLMNAPTVGEALEIACRYYPTFYLGATLRLSVGRGVARLTYRTKARSALSARHDNEWSLGFFVQVIRRGTSADWTPASASFTHSAPEDMSEQIQLFGANLHFGQATNCIEFPADVLRCRVSEADPSLLRVLLQQADGLLHRVQKEETLADQVRLLILEHLDKGPGDAAGVARKLRMSVSTLKRRLKQEGTSYRELRDGVVRNLSQSALRETQVPISEIAMRVGYSELSAFDRAFNRLAGMTPRQYRATQARKTG